MPDAVPNGAEIVAQPTSIVTQRRLEVNPKASATWMFRLDDNPVQLPDGAALRQRSRRANERDCFANEKLLQSRANGHVVILGRSCDVYALLFAQAAMFAE
jgi:hypothetical protein